MHHRTQRELPPLVYSPEYSFSGWDPKHRFVMDKFRHLHETLTREPVFGRTNSFISPEDPAVESGAAKRLKCGQGYDFTGPAVQAIDQHWLGLAHDPEYVRGFCEGTIPMRRIGLPWSQALVRRTRLEVAGTILTARLALEYGLACNLAGGTHHAHYSEGSGFTILNDLVVAARVLLDEFNTTAASSSATPSRRVHRVMIVDLDVHQGDGTAALTQHDDRIFALSFHCESNFPLRKVPSDLDVPLADGCGDHEYLNRLEQVLPPLLDDWHPDLVLYDAGVDVHVEDRLGRLEITTSGMRQRDQFVMQQCLDRCIPVATVIGGGYHADHTHLAKRHAVVIRTAVATWQNYVGRR
jgi:acetoin utilization deacetylase AcuC-like enzyme